MSCFQKLDYEIRVQLATKAGWPYSRIDTLAQLTDDVILDGQLISREECIWLLNEEYVFKCGGYNGITFKGRLKLKEIMELAAPEDV